MSSHTVFKGREEPMTQEQLAALATEAAQHAEQEADMGDDTIPQITSDIIPGNKNNGSDADDAAPAPAPKRKRGRPPSLAAKKIKREDSEISEMHLDDVEPFEGASSSQYGTPRGSPESPSTSRAAGKAKRKVALASANKAQKAGVTFISRARVAQKLKNENVDGDAVVDSDETEDDYKRQNETEDDPERQNESENDGEEESVEGNDAVNGQEVPVQIPRRGRPRKNVAAAEADPPKRRGRPSKPQTPIASNKAIRGNNQSKRHRISARLKILQANRSVSADAKRSLRSSGKNTDTAKKVSSAHTRGVAQVKKTPKKRPIAARAESEDDEYEVERIVGVEPAKGKKKKKYEVKWKGYPNSENTMEPEDNLANCKHLIAAFEKKQLKAVKK